ncbi:hypothetical protein M422DRAFT_37407 [Sphaerobolus stellatus SS14]|uniref:Luciferase domain-containing protein n=1 Tax=Sphaerobolus stellatus (strain SS14) TaxID=990650 RepID=A0A0C9UGP4_SPHS4|nr:hypothetical protein M422DRAFT_37407 [Sphaerobolus stellatus SS14]
MSSITRLPEHIIQRLPQSVAQVARTRPLLLALGIVGTTSSLYYLINDYFRFKALGKGGVPNNITGYLQVLLITPLARRQSRITDTSDLENIVKQIREQEGDEAVFHRLKLEERRGERPEVRGIIPQRQTNAASTDEMRKKLVSYIGSLASKYPTLLRASPSSLEGETDALFVQRHPSEAFASSNELSSRILSSTAPRSELTHIHPTEGSLHVSLSPADSMEVIRKGWGTRHRLSGKLEMPVSYTLVYAPQNEEELEVVRRILRAGVEYVTGCKVE